MQDIYELKDEYKTLEATLNEMFEHGHIDEECVNNTMSSITGSLEGKCVELTKLVKNKEGYIAALELRASEIEARLKTLKNRINKNKDGIDYYKSIIRNLMHTMKKDKIETDDFVIKEVGKKASVIITDESLIPDEYTFNHSAIKVSKQDAYKDLMAGIEVPGMKLGEGKKLDIK